VTPIGFWTTGVALDLAGEERAADLALAWGILSALPAAATGAAQWVDAAYEAAPRRLGTLHALTNSAALGLNGLSWLARKSGQRSLGQGLALAGFGTMLAGAWLGGDLAYDLGIGVNHAAFESPPSKWEDLCAEADLELGKPRRFETKDGAAVMLLRHEDGLHAIGAVCTHLGGPLDEGEIEGECVECPWHDSKFDLRDGRAVGGPATMAVAVYETKVEKGRVSVRVRKS
jgi:nitrite reductase/ring-hydroxylating ferredoxin subunit